MSYYFSFTCEIAIGNFDEKFSLLKALITNSLPLKRFFTLSKTFFFILLSFCDYVLVFLLKSNKKKKKKND